MFFFFFTDCGSSVPGSCALYCSLLVVTPGRLFLLCTWAPHCHDKHPCLAKFEGHPGLCLPHNTRASVSFILALPSWFLFPSPPRPPGELTSGGPPLAAQPSADPHAPCEPRRWESWGISEAALCPAYASSAQAGLPWLPSPLRTPTLPVNPGHLRGRPLPSIRLFSSGSSLWLLCVPRAGVPPQGALLLSWELALGTRSCGDR